MLRLDARLVPRIGDRCVRYQRGICIDNVLGDSFFWAVVSDLHGHIYKHLYEHIYEHRHEHILLRRKSRGDRGSYGALRRTPPRDVFVKVFVKVFVTVVLDVVIYIYILC